MARNTFTASAGTRFFFKEGVDQAMTPGDHGTEIIVSKYGEMPGNNDAEEFETTRASQVLEDGTPDFVKQFAPSYEDPGSAAFIIGGEDNIEALPPKRTYVTGMYLFNSGNYALFNGWVMKKGAELQDKGEQVGNFKIRATSELEFTYV